MDFLELIKKRRSVRDFDLSKKLNKEKINQLLAKAVLAPSEGNLQPWFFVVVLKEEIKYQLAQASWGQEVVARSAALVVTCLDKTKTFSRYGQRGTELYAIQSTALATYQLWLAAVNEEIAGCWIGAFDEAKVKEILQLEENLRPVAILCLGYPKFKPEKTERINPNQLTRYLE